MNKDICTYYIVSRLEDVVKDKESLEAYTDIGCYECLGLKKKCPVYKSVREHEVRYEDIK